MVRREKNKITNHAAKRSMERYGVYLNITEIKRKFEFKEVVIFEKENSKVVKMFVEIDKCMIPVIYNIKRKIVITVLPETALEVIRARIKYGL